MVGIDSNVFIFGIREEADNTGDIVKISKAKQLITDLDNQNIKMAIAQPMMAELLVRQPVEKHNQLLSAMMTRFKVAPLNPQASSVAAELTRRNLNDQDITALRESGHLTRRIIKFDCLILGCFIAHPQINKMYTDNLNEFKALANGMIDVHPLPEPYVQTSIVD